MKVNYFRVSAILLSVVLFLSISIFADENNIVPNESLNSDSSYTRFFSEERDYMDESMAYSNVIVIDNETRIIEKTDDSNFIVLYESDEPISEKEFYPGSDLIYFRKGNTVYRLHRESNTTDSIFTNNNMSFFSPISNYKIQYMEYTPEAMTFLNDGGELYDEEAYITWENTYNYNSITDSVEFISPEDLDFPGTDYPSVDDYFQLTHEIEQPIISPFVSHYTSYSTTINGKSIPLSSYGIGVFLNANSSTTACTHHTVTDVSSCNINGSCGCKYIGGGIQCTGFAKYVYNTLFGSYTYGTYFSGTNTNTASNAKSFFDSVSLGTRISSSGHVMILVKKGTDYVDIYHANYRNPCEVTVTKFTHTEFASKYKTVSGYKPT